MSTRSLTVFLDENHKEIVVMYRHYDGYPAGHGKDLADWARGRTVVNGLSGDSDAVWNGMSCLAADCVANFKKRPGDVYLHPAGTRDCGEEYVYVLYLDKVPGITPSRLFMEARSAYVGSPLYDGWIDEFDPEKCGG